MLQGYVHDTEVLERARREFRACFPEACVLAPDQSASKWTDSSVVRDVLISELLVDAHSHVFLHDYKEASSINQERDERYVASCDQFELKLTRSSFVERVVRGTMHCRKALLAGYVSPSPHLLSIRSLTTYSYTTYRE